MATASWSATGASLSLVKGRRPRSVFDAKTVLHEIPGKAGDQAEVLKRKSEMIYAIGSSYNETEFNNFRSKMPLLENAVDATFTWTHGSATPYNAVAVVVLHGEIELREGTELFVADWTVEMVVRE